ncbi:hypothetical protein KIM67_01480 [Flagellimonas sp. 389]|uniref:carbohydrate binding domain-containing protein n=1 Tax=Flagellimonas sp. 389 TaxID=2835862 RepID=UPI001BD5C05C|nr:carbohydrate binding domain-containing protein [Flagellimonas sp. 389]MBS9461063.1 hypothetical protein [Flagellimonas sp. 389]
MHLKNTTTTLFLLTLFSAWFTYAQTEKVYPITNFDGDGILPNAWQSYGDVGSHGVKKGTSESDGKYFELVWSGDTSEGYIVSQSDITSHIIPKKKLKGKTVNDVFLRMDVNCGDAPGTIMNLILVDGPNDCCEDEVNWLYSFKKNTCDWETIEINLGDFGYAYNPSNQDKDIDITKIARVKVSTDISGGASKQTFQFDNVALVVK